MRTGRSELHPKVTPEWLLAQGTNDELTPHDSEFGIPSLIYVPIILGGVLFAVIAFVSAPPRVYNEHDLVFAEELARRASTAMHNAELFQTAKKERSAPKRRSRCANGSSQSSGTTCATRSHRSAWRRAS